ncbi:unnamed protein product, partial [Nesidiocoris tenuis]
SETKIHSETQTTLRLELKLIFEVKIKVKFNVRFESKLRIKIELQLKLKLKLKLKITVKLEPPLFTVGSGTRRLPIPLIRIYYRFLGLFNCLDPKCGGHGTCVNGQCYCKAGWQGTNCSTVDQQVYQCLPGCSEHGTYDLESASCVCESFWTGPDCSQ